MKKWLFTLSILCITVLSACGEPQYVIDDATVVDKGYNTQSGWHFVTVEKNGSKYTYYVSQSQHDMAEIGSLIDVEKPSGVTHANLYPSERISANNTN